VLHRRHFTERIPGATTAARQRQPAPVMPIGQLNSSSAKPVADQHSLNDRASHAGAHSFTITF